MIRLAKPQDIITIKKIEDSSFDKIYHEDKDFYIENVMNDNCWILNENDIDCGVLIVEKKDNGFRIESVSVLPEYQGKGYGRKLCEFAETICPYDQIKLEVNTENKKAIDVYSKMGYTIDGISLDFYASKVDAIKMTKILR